MTLKVMDFELTCEEYAKLNNHLLACFNKSDWNRKPKTERKDFIKEFLFFIRN